MYGLDDELLTRITAILANNDRLEAALLFGSRAKGTFRPGSDVDIALKGRALTVKDTIQIGIELDDLETPYRFDLTIYHRITEPALRDHIDRVGQVLYQRAFSSIAFPHS